MTRTFLIPLLLAGVGVVPAIQSTPATAAFAAIAAAADDLPTGIDPEAREAYDALRARIRALRTLDMVAGVSSRMVDPVSSRSRGPADAGEPIRLRLDFRDADVTLGPMSRGRWDVLRNPAGGSAPASEANPPDPSRPERVVLDGTTLLAAWDGARTAVRVPDDVAASRTAFMMSFGVREPVIRLLQGWGHPDPEWLIMQAGEITGLRQRPEESIDGEACRVLEIRHERNAANRGGDSGARDGRTMRTILSVAIAVRDGLPRRIVVASGEVVDGEMPIRQELTIACSNVSPDVAFDEEIFATAIPAGYTEMSETAPVRDRLTVKAGDAAPDFVLQDETGRTVSLESLRGSVVLLDFWATWCGPCEAIKPVIDRIARDYEGRGVTVLGVNVFERDQAALEAHLAERKASFRTLLAGDELAKAYGIRAIPTLVLIHRDGTVAFISVGMATTLRQRIDEALARE